jgi:hypothetical protein
MRTLIAVTVFALVALLAAPASAQKDRSFVVSARAGVLTPGEYYIADTDYASYELGLSESVGLAAEYRMSRRLWLGAFVDVTNLHAFGESALFNEGGLTLKADVGSAQSSVRFRPLVGVGYGMLGPIYSLASTNYLTVKGGAEIVRGSYLLEISGYGAPSGGNDAFTVTFGPVAQVRLGRMF